MIVPEVQTLVGSLFTGASQEAAARCEAICIIRTEINNSDISVVKGPRSVRGGTSERWRL